MEGGRGINRDSNPLSVPVGPIIVPNIKLKGKGSERSFPVSGDLILKSWKIW